MFDGIEWIVRGLELVLKSTIFMLNVQLSHWIFFFPLPLSIYTTFNAKSNFYLIKVKAPSILASFHWHFINIASLPRYICRLRCIHFE